jgi:Holliday junction resolvasome RuvABC endonuclease subunit
VAFLGVDQSLRSTGVAVIGDTEELLELQAIVPDGLTGVPRLLYIRDELQRIIKPYQITLATVEGYAYDAVGRSFDLGEVGGVVRVVLGDAKSPLLVVAPAALKKFVAGNPQASKPQIRAAIQRKWKIDIENNDSADAYGLARVALTYATLRSKDRNELEVVAALKAPHEKPKPPAKSRTKISV